MFRSRCGVTAATGLALAILLTGPAPEANATPARPVPAATAKPASSTDQCSKPVSKRVGRWTCYAASTTSSAVAPQLTSTQTGWCDNGGCYERYDDFHVDYNSRDLYFGYGTRTLGFEHHYVNWQLVGSRITAKPAQYFVSIATASNTFSGSLLNAAPGRGGSVIPGTLEPGRNFGYSQSFTVIRWLPNGFTSYDNTQWDHSQVIEFSWKVPGYPGYWYSYVKSVCSHTQQRNVQGAIYRFDPVTGVPANPYGSGWQS